MRKARVGGTLSARFPCGMEYYIEMLATNGNFKVKLEELVCPLHDKECKRD